MRLRATHTALAIALAMLGGVASAAYEADIAIDRAPSRMSPNSKADVDLTIKNTGTDSWPPNTYLNIDAVVNPSGDAVEQAAFTARKQIGSMTPGLSQSVKGVEIEAPEARGTWTLSAWIEIGSTTVHYAEEFQVEVEAGYDGRFTRFDAPDVLLPGETYTFKITAGNSGDVQWDAGDVVLDCKVRRTVEGSASEGKAAFETRYRIENEGIVYPGQDYAFDLRVEAPPNNGEWELEWQLYDQAAGDYFGQKGATSHLVATNTGGYSARISIDRVPSSLQPEAKGVVEVTVTNTGKDLPEDAVVVLTASEDPQGNRVTQSGFDAEVEIGVLPAGHEAELELPVEGPRGRGEWEIEAWVEVKGSRISSMDTEEIEIRADYDGKVSSVSFKDPMKAKTKYTITVRVENEGDVWWEDKEVGLDVRLKRTNVGSADDGEKAFEQLHKLVTKDDVFPDKTYEFDLQVTTPARGGEWELELQLYDIEQRESFGDKKVITVTVEE